VSTDTADSPLRAMLLVIKWGTLHVQNAITNLDEMRVWRRIIHAIVENITRELLRRSRSSCRRCRTPVESDRNIRIHSRNSTPKEMRAKF